MKLGFIGFGNMAQAIAEGLLRSKALEPEQICAVRGLGQPALQRSPGHAPLPGRPGGGGGRRCGHRGRKAAPDRGGAFARARAACG
ncbi:MAG: NAD(P)-binding domain-containing protein [Ruthenibacterium lactatiformans]